MTGKSEIEKASILEELDGKLASDPDEQRLMRSVLEGDEEKIDEGKLITDAINNGMGSFTPDLMFEQLVKNYSVAKKLYGKGIIQKLTGYSESEVNTNIRIPEFQRELKKRIEEKIKQLKDQNLLDRDNNFTKTAEKLASIILYTEELDNLARGVGEKAEKKRYAYGLKEDTKSFSKDRYRDIAIRKSIKRAARRGHTELIKEDLVAFERKSKGERNIIYALDSSGSMKGEKLDKCKKAGIALAFKAIENNDNVGLIVFGASVNASVAPTKDFKQLLREITVIRAKQETDIALTIKEAILLFPEKEGVKHLIIITDAIPTKGKNPEENTLKAVSEASSKDITISVVGIELDGDGESLAEKIAEHGNGRLFKVRKDEEFDKIVLADYDEI